jgi:hypothetical protein
MLPAFLCLWSAAGDDRSSRRWFQIACLQLALVVDVPTRLAGVVPRGTLAASLIDHFDRLLVLACFVDVTVAWIRITRLRSDRGPATLNGWPYT